ncbi:hypothetical protein DESC_540010 [Desulfosarcina cetonica]|nr:hypothetical protein DESC_540010 [Desulfosarcina cetonica]
MIDHKMYLFGNFTSKTLNGISLFGRSLI